jgi:hypothetical protein
MSYRPDDACAGALSLEQVLVPRDALYSRIKALVTPTPSPTSTTTSTTVTAHDDADADAATADTDTGAASSPAADRPSLPPYAVLYGPRGTGKVLYTFPPLHVSVLYGKL